MRILLFLATLLATFTLPAQNVGIGTQHPLSKLHIAGDLRIDSLAARDSGVVVHNKNGLLRSVRFTGKRQDVLRGDGTFQSLAASAVVAEGWTTTGNTGIGMDNFLGTIDDQPLRFRVNNIPAGSIQTSSGNVAFGVSSLQSNTTGIKNIAIGTKALYANTSGSVNIAIGEEVLSMNTTGPGDDAGWANVGIGWQALKHNVGGGHNTAIGNLTMSFNAYGKFNTAVGGAALEGNTNGSYNTAVGHAALWLGGGGSNNTAVGFEALNRTETSNQTAIGYRALYYSASGRGNSATGYQSQYQLLSGNYNTADGESSLYNNRSGSYNTAVGAQAIFTATTGGYNSAFGYKALFLTSTGDRNTGAGFKALNGNTTGSYNSALGYEALAANISGSNNTAIGAFADVKGNNITNATAIGYNAKVDMSNKIRIGNAAITKIEGQVPFSTPSDGRYKFNVREDVKGLSFIMKLRPVTYQFDVRTFDGTEDQASLAAYNEASQIRRTGFIAQEVETAAHTARYEFNGIIKPQSPEDHYSLSYEAFVVPLVKAVQEQQQLIAQQHKMISLQQIAIENLTKRINQLEVLNKVSNRPQRRNE